MGWRTYLIMYFGTKDGDMSMSDIVKKVEELGFSAQLGTFDFAYNWGEDEPTKDQVFELGNKLMKVLHGTGTVFNLDTHD